MAGHTAALWRHEDGRVRCLLCPHACLIADGGAGVCGVRRAVEGGLTASTYGLVSSLAVDPIEKKPVYHYRPGSAVYSLGSVGCTMRCGHCQNWRISRATPTEGGLRHMEPDEVVAGALARGCAGIAFTYNEPVIWAEFVRDCGELAHRAGLFTVMVTNGWITEAGLDHLAPALDVWRVDVKAMTDEAIRRLCRVPSPQPVLRAAERARQVHGLHVEVVTNLVPGVNDDEDGLRALAGWIASGLGTDVPWHVTRFFPYLEFSGAEPTPIASLLRAREIGLEAGLRFVYVGNADVPGGSDTRCPSCGALMVERDGFAVVADRSSAGSCTVCGAALGIVVSAKEGSR